MSVLELDLTVAADDVMSTLPQIVTSLRPHWTLADVKTESKSHGYVNQNVRCYVEGRPDEDFLIRIFNHQSTDPRQKNVTVMKYMQRYGLCAPLLCVLNNGLCMGYIHGRSFSWDQHRDTRQHWKAIAREMARYHALTSPEEALALGVRDACYGVMDTLLDRAKAVLNGDVIPESARARLPTADQIKEGCTALGARLTELGAGQCFIHLDVNPTNVIIKENGDAFFIDYECGSVGPPVLDIAWTFVTSMNPLKFDIADYPDDKEQTTFARAYLEQRAKLLNLNDVTDSDVTRLINLVKIARLCAYLRMVTVSIALQTSSSLIVRLREKGHVQWEDDNWVSFVMWRYYQDHIHSALHDDIPE